MNVRIPPYRVCTYNADSDPTSRNNKFQLNSTQESFIRCKQSDTSALDITTSPNRSLPGTKSDKQVLPTMQRFAVVFLATASFSLLCQGFVRKPLISYSRLSATTTDGAELSQLGLTPELEKYVNGFRSVSDDKLRYQQLFFLASKCSPMDAALKIEKNKVIGHTR